MKEGKFISGFKRVVGGWREDMQGKLIEYDGYRWQVGVEDGEYPLTVDDLLYFYPLVLKSLGLESKEVAISLPAETYLKDRDYERTLKSKLKDELGVIAHVYPQGIVSLAYMEVKEPTVLVIDGGFNTINACVVNTTGELKVKWLKTYYNEFGIRDLLEGYFREELLRKFPEVPNNFQILLRVFLNGYVDTGFRKQSVEEEKRISIRIWQDSLMRRIRGDILRANRDFDAILVVGGLSYYITREGIEKPLYIPQDGEYANLRGLHNATSLDSVDFGFGHVKYLIDTEQKRRR